MRNSLLAGRLPGIIAASAGSLWAPESALSGALVAHWDAQQGVTQSAGAVSQWVDTVAGLAATQATAAAQPTFSATARNGKPGLVFNGSAQYLAFTPSAGFPSGTATSTIAGASYGQGTATGHVLAYGVLAGGQIRSLNDRNGFVGAGNGAAPDHVTTTSSNGVDRFAVWEMIDTASSIITDGGAANTLTLSGNNTGLTLGRIGTFLNQSEYFAGTIQQILVFNRSLTATERQKLEGWESWYDGKAGANLPSGHPYKSAAPTA